MGLIKKRWTPMRTAGLLLTVLFAPIPIVGSLFLVDFAYPLSVRPIKKLPAEVGLTHRDLTVTSRDGTTLRGWYLPPEKAPAPLVVLCHGHKGTASDFLKEAAFLHEAGYGVVMPHLRHHGNSDKGLITFGLREADDVLAFVDESARFVEHAGQPIGAIGFSMGAVTVLHATAKDTRLKAVVADSPFVSLPEQARTEVRRMLPTAVVEPLSSFLMASACTLIGVGADAWDVKPWLEKIAPRPVFLIHGLDDQKIPHVATETLAASVPAGSEIWYVPGARHIEARKVARDEYAKRVLAFLAPHLKPGAAPGTAAIAPAAP